MLNRRVVFAIRRVKESRVYGSLQKIVVVIVAVVAAKRKFVEKTFIQRKKYLPLPRSELESEEWNFARQSLSRRGVVPRSFAFTFMSPLRNLVSNCLPRRIVIWIAARYDSI